MMRMGRGSAEPDLSGNGSPTSHEFLNGVGSQRSEGPPMSSGRLEMVVKGQRQTALTTNPRLIGPALLDHSFILEEHYMCTFEMPDHWIPNYLVALTLAPQPAKRSLFEAGR